jgi:hypothetical protein
MMKRYRRLPALVGLPALLAGCGGRDAADTSQASTRFQTTAKAGELKPDLALGSIEILEPEHGAGLVPGRMTPWRVRCRTKPGAPFRHRVDIEILRGDTIAGGGTLDQIVEKGDGVCELTGQVQAPSRPGAYKARAVASATYTTPPGPDGADPARFETARSYSEAIDVEVKL